jgi:hypothetical protein
LIQNKFYFGMNTYGTNMTPQPHGKDEKEEMTGHKTNMDEAIIGSKYESAANEGDDGRNDQGEISPQ